MNYLDSIKFDGINTKVAVYKLLNVLKKGEPIDNVYENPLKYIVPNKTKKIIINTGGEGLKLSVELIHEMAKRGDSLAQHIIDKNKFQTYSYSDLKFAHLEHDRDTKGDEYSPYCDMYDRENKILIDMIESGNCKNTGGMTLEVIKVYDDDAFYKICRSNDHWGSEYVKGELFD